MRLVNPSPIVLFIDYRLTTSSGKHLKDINHAHIVCLMYKLLTSTKGFDDLSIGFDRSRDRRQRELSNNKTGEFHLRFYLKDVFSFAEHQHKATFELGYKLTLTGNTDNVVLNKDNAINNAKSKINAIEW